MNILQKTTRSPLYLLAWCTLAVPPAFAQTITHVSLFTIDSIISVEAKFGESLSGAGDVNGDGVPDVIVGAAGADSGSARVLSGANGSVLYNFEGDSSGDAFGFSVSGAGDVNGDGFADLIVGAPFDDNNGSSSGSARVFSGVDGSVLYTFLGDSAGDEFGASVRDAGDVNGDGVADLIVGARADVNGDGVADLIVGARADDNNGADSGSARVFSGVDGSVLYTFDGDSAGDGFGFALSSAGDLNGDGFADLIVGASGDDNSGANSGSARVLSGADGSVLYNFDGDSTGDFFTRSLNGAGDVNGDGVADLIVGIPQDDNNGLEGSGSARVFSGADGSVLYSFDGDSTGDLFGRSVNGAGDVNGDGFADVIVGIPRDDNNGADSGSARVFSGVDGSVLYNFDGDSAGDGFGRSVSGIGDVNGDGIVDLIVGGPNVVTNGVRSGSARVFSGADGSVVYNFEGGSAGESSSSAGDVNGDGVADLIVGAARDDSNGVDSGSARVLSGVDDSVLYTFFGDSAGDEFGFSVSGAGDVNGDGFADLIVGARGDDNNGTDSGSARVFSGVDGSVLYTFNGDSADDGFGFSVNDLGDVNGDGVADFSVNAFKLTNNGGYLRVFASQITAAPILIGDCDQNEVVDLFDIAPFIGFLTSNTYLEEADVFVDGEVNVLDIAPFIAILTGN